MAELVSVDVRGVRELLVKLDRLGNPKFADELVTEVGSLLLNRIRTRFLNQTDPDGNKWPESQAGRIRKAGGFTYRYINGTRKRYTGTGTLFESGALWNSLQFARLGKGEGVIGTDVPYAKYLQGPEAEVERTFLGFGRDDEEFTEEFLARRIQDLYEKG